MKRSQPDPVTKFKAAADLSSDEIIARSIASGVIFVIVLTILDAVMQQPINIWQTISLGLILAGVLCAFDLLQRAGARKKLK